MEPNWMIPLERDVLQAAISLGRFDWFEVADLSGYCMRETKTALAWLKARGMIEPIAGKMEVTESAKIVFAIMLGKRSCALAKKRGEIDAAKIYDPRQARQSERIG